MRYTFVLFLLLASCSAPLEPVIAPAIVVESLGCQSTHALGEPCLQDCACLSPLACVDGICSVTGLADGEPCAENEQCASQYCTDLGHCGGPEQTSDIDCNYICRTAFPSTERECYITCR